MVPTSGPPEIYVFVGIIIFLALSLIAYVLSEHISGLLPPIYQIIALVGLGVMYLTNFVFQTDMKTRASLSITYLFIAILNVLAFNILAVNRSRSVSLRLGWSFSMFILQLSDAISSFVGLFRRKSEKRRRRHWIKK